MYKSMAFLFALAICTPECQNGGQCIEPNVCRCYGWEGDTCERGQSVTVYCCL